MGQTFDELESRDASHASCTEAVTALSVSSIPFLIGGTVALRRYTGTERATKDLDIFVRSDDVHRVLDLFGSLGCRTALPFPHWLGKVFIGDYLVDVIFSSGNGVARVDHDWFVHAVDDEFCGVPVRLSPPEEMIWSKSFVQERERFDGADVLHLIHSVDALDWPRLLGRFGPHWRVLLGHLVLFGFAYPAERHRIPAWVMARLTDRLRAEDTDANTAVCNGTLLSREQYLEDLGTGGYQDGREAPAGMMTREEIAIWTAAITDHP